MPRDRFVEIIGEIESDDAASRLKPPIFTIRVDTSWSRSIGTSGCLHVLGLAFVAGVTVQTLATVV